MYLFVICAKHSYIFGYSLCSKTKTNKQKKKKKKKNKKKKNKKKKNKKQRKKHSLEKKSSDIPLLTVTADSLKPKIY